MTRAGHPPSIFICYRREDTGGYARLLFDSLVARFGSKQVFMDIEGMEPGEDFVLALEAAVGACEVLLALIGPDWLADRNNVRRLDDPKDFVRLEIATALRRQIRVIPVLAPGAKMPKAEDLPPALSPLSRRQALDLSQRYLKQDIDHLISVIEGVFAPRRAEPEPVPRRWPGTPKRSAWAWPLLILVVACLAAVGVWRWRNSQETPATETPSAAASKAEDGGPPAAPTPQTPPGMVYVRAGEFLMGNDNGDKYERPAHRVGVAPFFMDVHEVTNEEYAKFIGAVKRSAPPTWRNGVYGPGAERQPVTGVTWEDARLYAEWRSRREGGTYRLPTEAEWEYAARGHESLLYPWGGEWLPGRANANRERERAGEPGLANVGSYPEGRSPFGVLDMVGNAWEWTGSELRDYGDGRLLENADGRVRMVMRGGSFNTEAAMATATYRNFLKPTGEARERYSKTGFRCVREVGPATAQR
jgi:formylglycine-generating enzyme required for sulfatase activity